MIVYSILLALSVLSKGYANEIRYPYSEENIAFNYDKIIEVKLIEHSNSCSIYELRDENGMIIYNVIAAVATAWLPEIVEGFCEKTIGDQHICNTVYDVTSMVVALRGKSIYKGITRGMNRFTRWIAHRDLSVSKATVEARTYSVATTLRAVFDAYHEKCANGNGIPWETVHTNSDISNTFSSNYHSFYRFESIRPGNIISRRVNFRTTPSIEKYNKIFQLGKGTPVLVMGYKIPDSDDHDRITKRDTYFTTVDGDQYIIENGIAVKYISSYNASYAKVKLLKNDGSQEYGYIAKNDIRKMDNKKWYKIKSSGRIGWVYEDFIRL